MQVSGSRPLDETSGLYRLKHGHISENVVARIAATHETLLDAARIRYDAYQSRGYIDKNPEGLFADEIDASPSCTTIVVYKNGAPAASARTCLYDPSSNIPGSDWTPAMDVFRHEILALLNDEAGPERSHKALEVMRLVRHPQFERDNEIIFALLRAIGYLILYRGVNIIYSGVRRNHIPIYRRLGFFQVTEPRSYPKLKFRTALIACIKTRVATEFPEIDIFGDVSKSDSQYIDIISGKPTVISKIDFNVQNASSETPSRVSPTYILTSDTSKQTEMRTLPKATLIEAA